jgi:hypothetical protein
MGAQALAVRGRLLVQTPGPLDVPAEDGRCGYYAAAAALPTDQAEVSQTG